MNVLDDNISDIALIEMMGDESRIVDAARVSLNSDLGNGDVTERDVKLIDYLLKNQHSSPFEHVIFTFMVTVPLFVRSQWMRHRTWSFNEVSRRYTSEDIRFFIPKFFRKQSESNRQASTEEKIECVVIDGKEQSVEEFVEQHSRMCNERYESLLAQGVSREQARMILPQNLYTRFYGTVDLWNLIKFLMLRNSSHAQSEIREYAKAIEKIVSVKLPYFYKVWKKDRSEDD